MPRRQEINSSYIYDAWFPALHRVRNVRKNSLRTLHALRNAGNSALQRCTEPYRRQDVGRNSVRRGMILSVGIEPADVLLIDVVSRICSSDHDVNKLHISCCLEPYK